MELQWRDLAGLEPGPLWSEWDPVPLQQRQRDYWGWWRSEEQVWWVDRWGQVWACRDGYWWQYQRCREFLVFWVGPPRNYTRVAIGVFQHRWMRGQEGQDGQPHWDERLGQWISFGDPAPELMGPYVLRL
jgi:hypothetical protein